MFSSIMVPEGVRRLFQVLTGEDMTDADEGALFAVADVLESGAAGLGEVRALVAELVGKVRTEFSGKAADRFADGLGIFDGLLSSGQAGLLDLAAFVRKTSQQVRYLKLVTIYGLELLAVEMSWAMQFAGATAGATLAWLAARMAVMRFLLTSWWRQLFMRLAMMAAGGVVFNVLPDVQAQLTMRGEESAEKWDRTLTEQAAGMGAFSALVALPMSAVGGLVSNTLTKVLVKGLGDDVDAAILEAAAKKAVAEHAELYPVSAMAKFADAVGKSLDNYAGMSVGAMWLARFGHSVGEALAGSLSEFFGEALYAAATGQKVTWNPFSLTAGFFETVFSGVGNLAGLALRGKLHPEGPSPYLEGTGGGGGGSDDGGGSGGEKTPLPGAGSGSQTGDIPGSPDKDSVFIPSDASDSSDGSRSDRWAGSDSGAGSDSSSVSDVDSVFSDTGSVDSAAVSVPSGDGLVVPGSAVVSAVVVGGTDGKDGTDGTDGKRGADGSVPGRDAAGDVPVVPGSGQHRPGTPPPAYSSGVPGVDPDRPGTPLPAHFGGVPGVGPDRPGTPPPPYSPGPGGDQAVPGKRPLEVSASKTPDSPTVTPHASDVPADAARPETGKPGSVVGPDGRVPAGHPASETVGSGSAADSGSGVSGGHPESPSGVTGRDGDPGADSVAGRGDAHRQDGAVVSPDSATLPGEGSPAAPSLHRDPAAVLPAGLPADTVRVPVPANVVAGDRLGLAEFVRSHGADSPGGPVLLVSPSDPNAGVVVTRGQGLALARDLGRNVVAMMPGQAGREPQFMVFPADRSRPKSLAGPGAAVLAGGRSGGVAGLADASATVPAASGGKTRGEAPAAGTGSAQARSVAGEVQPASTTPGAGAGMVRDTSGIPVGQWTQEELVRAIARARELGLSSDEKDAAAQIVWLAHDVQVLARGDAVVPLEDVVALVAAKYHDLGKDHRDQVVKFSRALADWLGTRRSKPVIHAGAGPEGHTADGGPSGSSSAAVPRNVEGHRRRAETATAKRRTKIAELEDLLKPLRDEQASLEASLGRDEADAGSRTRGEELQGRIARWQAVLDGLKTKDQQVRARGAERTNKWRERQQRKSRAARLGAGGPSPAGRSDQIAGRSEEPSAAAELSELITNANAGLDSMRQQELPVDQLIDAVKPHMESFGGHDGLRDVMAHHMLRYPGDSEETRKFERKLHKLTTVRNWDEWYERDATRLDKWAGIVGRDAVDRLLADADMVLGSLRVSLRFRTVLAQWLGEHPGDRRGAQAVRGIMAGYLAGDPDLGVAVSGLTLDEFETAKAEEARWQEDRAANPAEAAAPMVRGFADDPALDVISRISSIQHKFEDVGQELRQWARTEDQDAVDLLYDQADQVLGPLKESEPFRDVMAHELLMRRNNLRDDQQLQRFMTNPQDDPQLRQLRWELARYLAGDLTGGADPDTADNLLSAGMGPLPEDIRSRGKLMYNRRLTIGKALSGLQDDAVNEVLRNAALEDLRRGKYSHDTLGKRFYRSGPWGGTVFVIRDLQDAVGSLRQVLAEAETNTDRRDEYEPKIAEWLNLRGFLDPTAIRSRATEVADAVRLLRQENANREPTQDGRMLPVFDNGEGTGQWYLRSRDGELEARGSELRTAVNDSAVPTDPEGAPPAPVFRWAGTPGPSRTRTAGNEERKARGRERWHREKAVEAARVAELEAFLKRANSGQDSWAASQESDAANPRQRGDLQREVRDAQAELKKIADDRTAKKAKHAADQKSSEERKRRVVADARASLAAARAGRAELEELPGFDREDRRRWEALQREEAAALEVLHDHELMRDQVAVRKRKLEDRYKDEWAQESKSLRELMARQAKLEVLTARDETETRGEELAELEGLPGRIAEVQAKLPGIAKLEAERKANHAEKEKKNKARRKANTLLATFRTRREELVESDAVQGPEWEEVQGSIAALEAELAAIANDDMGSGATARGNGGADREMPAGVVELVGLVGRVEGHLSVLPAGFRRDLHDQVEEAWAMAKKGSWIRGDPARIDSQLERMRDLERWLGEVVRSPGVVELEGLVGRVEGHLSMVPADVLLDVRAGVVKAKAMARQGSWTPKDRAWIDSKLAGMRKGERWLAEVVSSPGVVEFVGLVERLEGHLSVLPADFRPDVRAGVVQARVMARKGNWTREDLSLIDSELGRMRKLERWLRLEPVVFGVDPGVVKLASGLRGVQVVGVHVTPDGQAQSADDVLETPEDFAARVLSDERFVPGVPVAFLGCGALRQPPGGEDSFAKRFEDASGVKLMLATEADVWHTDDGLIHATETAVTQDGRIFPVFDNNKGTGYWSLRNRGREVGALGSELRTAVNDFHRDRGRQVEARGSELRTAVNDSAVPRHPEGAHSAPVFKWAGTPGPSRTSRTAENEEKKASTTEWRHRKKAEEAALVADGRALLEKLTTRQAELKALPGLDEEQTEEWNALLGRIAEVQANVAAVEQKGADRRARDAASERRRYERTKREKNGLVDARKVLLEQLMVQRAPLAVLAELTVLDTNQRAELEELDASIEEVRNELATIANEEQARKAQHAERMRKQRARKKRGQADALASLAAARAGRAKLKELPGFTEVLQADPATLPEFYKEPRRQWEALQREEAAALELLHEHERMRNQGVARMRKSEDRYKDEWAQESKSLRELMARQAQLETLMARNETRGEELAELAGLPGRIAEVQAKLPAIAKLEAERKANNAENDKKNRARKKANTLLATLKAQRAKLVESDSVQGPEWEEVQGSIAALEAELAAIENDDTGSGATARGNGGADREAPAGVVELVGLVGRVEGHLSVLPAGFRPDLHGHVEEAWAMAKKGSWTPADRARIDSQLAGMRELERWLGAVVRSPGVVELVGLVGRVEGHLSMVPADVLLDVRAGVVKAKAMARQGSWTPEDRAWIDSKLAGMRKGERWLAEVVSSPEVVEFVGLVERLEGHLSVLPADFRPDVRAGVVQAKAMAQKGNWTPEELSLIASNLGRMRKFERWLRLEPVVFGGEMMISGWLRGRWSWPAVCGVCRWWVCM
ncbi:hypothetical protein [Saccharopolyspora sp. ASAGF58]|uniref:WXG100-like domain-containing protein n=1 Tax=Saccharopolyspora sp. ASAGF58 TaxID=2719023 RepID=UPI001444A4F0|nr:hypothetical protein [Saccharopolyspora sp. ASAGF58]